MHLTPWDALGCTSYVNDMAGFVGAVSCIDCGGDDECVVHNAGVRTEAKLLAGGLGFYRGGEIGVSGGDRFVYFMVFAMGNAGSVSDIWSCIMSDHSLLCAKN